MLEKVLYKGKDNLFFCYKKLKWVRVNDKISIIDSPGMLWPKFEDTKIGNNLAAVRKYKR